MASTRTVQDGVEGWMKVCTQCHKSYFTSVRHQKFCTSICAQKSIKRRQENRKEYALIRDTEKVRHQSHALARRVVEVLVLKGLKEHKCEVCGAEKSAQDKPLEVHHINANWFDNRPSNLQLLCKSCHAKVHSVLDVKTKEDDYFTDLEKVFIRPSH